MSASAVPPTNGRFAPFAVVTLTVLVFGAVVALITLRLRSELQAQLLRGAADQLAAVAAMQLDNSAEEYAKAGMSITEVPGALLVAALKTSKLRGVTGVSVFDNQGHPIVAWPLPTSDTPPASDWAAVRAGQSVARLHRQLDEQLLSQLALSAPEPVIEAWVPLRQTGPAATIGAAQFWVRGENFIGEMAEHDRRLWLQGVMAWLAGSAVIVAGLGWAFRRLARANAALRARGEDLQRANRELVLAAKTSALGAVTAHLMHELKNPLAGLEVIVAGTGEAAGDLRAPGGEMAAASELTRRLRTMVNDVVGVLRDEQTAAQFELTAADIIEAAAAKVQPDAQQRGVTLQVGTAPAATFAGRRGNLAILVLRNLLQNALEATPAGGTVRLGAAAADRGAAFLVEDGGTGLPDAVRARLFQPCASTKIGGSGLGLALSYQLAQQAGGRLELVRSDAQGTRFRLVLAAEA